MATKKKVTVSKKKPIVKEEVVEQVIKEEIEIKATLPVIDGIQVTGILKETSTEILYQMENGSTTYVQK